MLPAKVKTNLRTHRISGLKKIGFDPEKTDACKAGK
jgi:hypothetical protein